MTRRHGAGLHPAGRKIRQGKCEGEYFIYHRYFYITCQCIYKITSHTKTQLVEDYGGEVPLTKQECRQWNMPASLGTHVNVQCLSLRRHISCY